jgi:hypothetical protein
MARVKRLDRLKIVKESAPVRLDLGSGPRPKEGFDGVDIVPKVARWCFDLCGPDRWPFTSNSVDELHSSHFIEHIDAGYNWVEGYPSGRVDKLYWFLDEAFRIAKNGAVFTVQWPALQSVRAFQDPTHRRFIPAESTMYWSIDGRKALGQEHLGIKCNWVGTCQPTISIEPENEEDKQMQLRADSSDEKQAWAKKKNEEMARRYRDSWNYSCDFVGVFRAVKS